jgi:O-antigen/teichoic acid export membrane protein
MAGVPSQFLSASSKSISVLAVIMVLSNVGAAYEAIVMGGHRIDLARTFTTVFTVVEAIAIVAVLHFGYGLFAMACVMAASEVGFVISCYLASKDVVPKISVRPQWITKSVLPELFRFAGSYQLVNVLEIVYVTILPIAVLKSFGAETAGIYALALRLVSSAMMLPDAFLLPILSGGTMMYASGSADGMARLISKSYKVTLALSLLPMALIAAYGRTLVYAWTGESIPNLSVVLSLACLAGLFGAFSILGLVLYRVSGRAILDNIRQVLRIAILFIIAMNAHRIGFYGVLMGLALAELAGMFFMMFAIVKTFPSFHLRFLLSDTGKLVCSTLLILAVVYFSKFLPFPTISNSRVSAALQIAKVCLGCLVAAWPAMALTKSITPAETKILLQGLFSRRRSSILEVVRIAK